MTPPSSSITTKDSQIQTLTLTLIPGLPNDLAGLILSFIPYSHHARLKPTSKSWRIFFSFKTLISIRMKSKLSHLLCVFPQDPSISSPYLFDPQNLAWCPLPPMPCNPHVYGLCNFTSIFIAPHLYVLGGSLFDTRSFPMDRPSPSSSAFRFDFLTHQWESLSPMLSPRGSFACVAIPNSDKILVAGGGSRHTMFGAAGSRMSSVEMYDIRKDEWAALDGLPRFRAGCVGFLVGSGEEKEFWVMGGYGESRTVLGVFPVDEYYRDAVVMEMKNGGGKWRELGDMWQEGERRRLGRIAVLEGQGWDTPAIFMLDRSDIFRYDMSANRCSWMDVVSSQEASLLSLDLSGSDVTDSGLMNLKDCKNLQALNLNYCDQISDHGLECISYHSNLTTLSFRRNNCFTAKGMSALSGLVNLLKLDLERCPGIHGGLVHLKGLSKLESLNINCCNCITDTDMKPLAGITNLKELQISSSKVTDYGVTFLKALNKLTLLNMEGCPVTAACLESLSALTALLYLNLSRCSLTDDGCSEFSKLQTLKVLNLGFNEISDAILVHLKGLKNLESLNLDSCRIGDEELFNLSGLQQLKCLELSDTEVGSNGLHHLSGLTNLESLNLSFTVVTDGGLRKLSGLSYLKSLNLDARQITDAGLAALTSLTGLTHLDLFCARITDSGTNYLRSFKNLRSLEICGGGITDAGVKNIKDLSSLTMLNLSQNHHLTDRTLELISGLTELVSLNVSSSRITSGGLKHLKPLKNLRSLTLESCKLNASDIKKLQSADLPNLVSFRPE